MGRMANPYLVIEKKKDSYPRIVSQHDVMPYPARPVSQVVLELELIGVRCATCDSYACKHIEMVHAYTTFDAEIFLRWWRSKSRDTKAKDWPSIRVQIPSGSIYVKLVAATAEKVRMSDIEFLNVVLVGGPLENLSIGLLSIGLEGFQYITDLVLNTAAGIVGSAVCTSQSHWRTGASEKLTSEADLHMYLTNGTCVNCSRLANGEDLLLDDPEPKWKDGKPALLNKVQQYLSENGEY